MRRFLEKIKLIEHLSTELEIQKNEFIKNFKNQVDEGNIGPFSGAFEAFSLSKNEYKGHVGYDGFRIKRRRRFFDMNMNLAIAKGNYRQKGNNLIIETEINGFRGMMVPFYIFLIVFYAIFIFGFFSTGNFEGAPKGFLGAFILIHAAFMFGIPYFIMRRGTKRFKHELEREFYYMTKK